MTSEQATSTASGQRQRVDRPWSEYPLGTRAHAIGGGHWIRVQHGWKWFNGDTFPRPGADAFEVTLPSSPAAAGYEYRPAPADGGYVCDDRGVIPPETVETIREGQHQHEGALQAVASLVRSHEALRASLATAEKRIDEEAVAMLDVLGERDRFHEVADRLAAHLVFVTVGGDPIEVIGEHSSMNCPWENALELEHPDLSAVVSERDAALALLNAPELHHFRDAVVLEAAHQRHRWGNDHDAGKEPQDWFWLVGYLAGKALRAHIAGDTEKALHHTISTAAALNNWHVAIMGASTAMSPGIDARESGSQSPLTQLERATEAQS